MATSTYWLLNVREDGGGSRRVRYDNEDLALEDFQSNERATELIERQIEETVVRKRE